jgi:phage tail-like protein
MSTPPPPPPLSPDEKAAKDLKATQDQQRKDLDAKYLLEGEDQKKKEGGSASTWHQPDLPTEFPNYNPDIYPQNSEFRKHDPIGNYLFAINLSGWATGWFMNVGGIGVEFDVIEHKLTSTTGAPFIIQIPGRPKWNKLTLKHGVLNGNEDLWTWMAYVQRGLMLRARTHCSLYLYNKAGGLAATWDIVNAWPSKISGPDLDAAGTTVAIESLELTHTGMWRTQ